MPGNIVRETVNEAASAKDAANARPVLFNAGAPSPQYSYQQKLSHRSGRKSRQTGDILTIYGSSIVTRQKKGK
jgi:hypothetical protein